VSTAPEAPIANAGEAERAIVTLNKIMDRLVETVEEETARVRAGKLRYAVELETAKLELSKLYAAEAQRVKIARAIIAKTQPQALDRLRKRHDKFQSMLQTNLTVLATAHAVAEGIVRGVQTELTRKAMPSTYGANGRATVPNNKAGQPISVYRSL
jgi:alpha-D-ribose 1-methylphosphonate 5-triphosphate synthase subunit PhnL